MTLKLQDLLAHNCPWRALALMQEAFSGVPLVSKMTARQGRRGRPYPVWPFANECIIAA